MNRLTSGSLDGAELISNRWDVGHRMESAASTSEVTHITRGAFQGPGALRARVTPIAADPLPGGYERNGRSRSRARQFASPPGRAIRIDAVVRTLGFGNPHQGLLVYDTIGGQEMTGVLDQRRTFRLDTGATVSANLGRNRRQRDVRVDRCGRSDHRRGAAEAVGAGVATGRLQGPMLMPIAEAPATEFDGDESTRR